MRELAQSIAVGVLLYIIAPGLSFVAALVACFALAVLTLDPSEMSQ
jgi:hypothetical protein